MADVPNVSVEVSAVSYCTRAAKKYAAEKGCTTLQSREDQGGSRKCQTKSSDFEDFLNTRKAMFGVFSNMVCFPGLLFYSLYLGT